MRRITPFIALILLSVSPLEAQRRDSTVLTKPNPKAGPTRLLGAIGGAAVGTFVGGWLGYNILPHDCGCDDPGLEQLVYGAFAGITVGAAFGASAPNLGSVCEFKRRLKRSLVGSAIAATTGFILGGGLGRDPAPLFLVPAGAIGGSLAAMGECWRSRAR